MIKAFTNYKLYGLWLQPIHTLYVRSAFNMGLLTDKLTQRQSKKSQQQFKKEIQYMANKPTFTLMDYKQRILDELNSLKNSVKKNMSAQAKQMEKSLTTEKKILSALFEEELVNQKPLNVRKKQQISVVTQIPIQKISEVFKKADSYKKMHKFLRQKHLKGQQLPESMESLQHEFRLSRHQLTGSQRLFMRLRQEKPSKGYMRAMRIRYMKFNK